MQYDPHVPRKLRHPKAFAAFSKELVNAVTCCEAVEQTPWNAPMAQEVLQKARQRKGRATVRAVSQPSQPSCSQRFMVFEAREDTHTTYIVAFRSDRECYNDIVSTPTAFTEVENVDNIFQVHKSLWWRAATMPLRSLPPQWRSGLREGRHRLILTGFSVGGAVAALATLQLLEAEDHDLREQICCYTFGTPLQGDQNYADRINQKYASNFYHVMINGDPIPGVLTLVSKVARNQPDMCGDVVSSICTLFAQVTTKAVLDAVATGAGAVAHKIDFSKLGSGITSLIVTERESRMPLPEYKFGGSLVLLDIRKNSSSDQMMFVPLLGDGRILEEVFCVQEKHVTSSGLQNALDVHRLKTFCQIINDLDNSYLIQAIKYASGDHIDRASREFSQRLDHSLDHINEMVKDGAGRVAKSTTNVAKSAARCVMQTNVEDNHLSSYLLEPKFDIEKPIQVWLDKHENITIEVSGENMVLGIHVLYIQNGEEKIRVPCTEKYMYSIIRRIPTSAWSSHSQIFLYNSAPRVSRAYLSKNQTATSECIWRLGLQKWQQAKST